jgi:glycine/D-amino acid oxidase-like deaminating enzyme
MWKDFEKEIGEQLIDERVILSMGDESNKFFQYILGLTTPDKHLSPSEIMEKYSALSNIPDTYKGMLSIGKGGLIKNRKSIEAFRKSAVENYGATFLYNMKVTKITSTSVEVEDGTVYSADNVVVSAGPYSAEHFDKDSTAKRVESGTLVFEDCEGFPDAFYEFQADQKLAIFGMLTGPDFGEYKIGLSPYGTSKKFLEYARERFPTKFDKVKGFEQFDYTQLDTTEFQYKTGDDGVHYAYGFNATGSQFFPIHGKIVYDGLITKKDQKYIQEKFRTRLE